MIKRGGKYLFDLPSLLIEFVFSRISSVITYSFKNCPYEYLIQIFLSFSNVFMGMNSVCYTILRVQCKIKELAALCSFVTLATLLGSYFIM